MTLQAEFLCEELFESSTPSQPLRLRAMQAQLEAIWLSHSDLTRPIYPPNGGEK